MGMSLTAGGAIRSLDGDRLSTLYRAFRATIPATRGRQQPGRSCADKHSRGDLRRHAPLRKRSSKPVSVQTTPLLWAAPGANVGLPLDTGSVGGGVARPKKHWPMVEASRDEASLAVRLYNDAIDIRSFEGFVVHMHLAWLYLLHAEFTRDNIDYRYWKRDNPRRLERLDGEP